MSNSEHHICSIPASHETKLNRLLAALPDANIKHWLPDLERIELPLGKVLYEAGGVEKYVYFPTTGIVSLLYVMKNGDAAEIAVVGSEGIVGISLFLGGDSTPSSAVVQSAGWCYRLKAKIMKWGIQLFTVTLRWSHGIQEWSRTKEVS